MTVSVSAFNIKYNAINKSIRGVIVREKFERFMEGRYGMDQLSRFLDFAALALLIVSLFIRGMAGSILFYGAVVLILWSYFRIFSRNTHRRYAENERFLRLTGKFVSNFSNRRCHQEQKKIYKYFYCPGCKQKVRVPKGKGRICITCPNCRREFVRRS